MPPKNQRGWWREEFYDHPGLAAKLPDSYTTAKSDKFKLFCKKCLDWTVAETIVNDQKDVSEGTRDVARTKDTITGQRTFFSLNFLDQPLTYAICV